MQPTMAVGESNRGTWWSKRGDGAMQKNEMSSTNRPTWYTDRGFCSATVHAHKKAVCRWAYRKTINQQLLALLLLPVLF